MIVLLDTATPTCYLTLINGDERHDYEWEAGRGLAKGLLSYLHTHLAENKADWNDIAGIGVYRGPGSFTGLRIGMTVLNTLADSLAVPIVGEIGENWQVSALARLQSGDNDQIVLPEYGEEAHITTPRK